MNDLKTLINGSLNEFDLTESKYQDSLYKLTESLLKLPEFNPPDLLLKAGDKSLPLEFRIAVHLSLSKHFLSNNRKPLKLGVVFGMWGEQNRLHPKSENNPNGEDTLRTKINQLMWATKDTPVQWKLYAVDDGCPYGSGEIAQQILADHPQQDKVQVLFLKDTIPTSKGPLRNLKSVDDSKKGGAIILGASKAIQDGMDAVMYTDADNSVHLGQIGILLEQYLEGGYEVVLGNRKDPSAVLVKQESRWGIGIKLLRHMQRMVGVSIFSQGILDSQAAFKLYDAQLLSTIIADPGVFDFSFDSDWIAAILKMEKPFAKVPFAFVDSFAESASIVQGPMTTWETLLMGLVKAVRHRKLPHNEEMARVLEKEILSSKDLDLLINHLPPELESVEDNQLGDPKIMSPLKVQEWIALRKQ